MALLALNEAGGGYILATDHSLHDDIPLENILAYVGVAKENGTYPLICSHEQPPQTKAQLA